MAGHAVPVAAFLEQINTWQTAFSEGRLDDARWAAREAAIVGSLLTMDSEFRRLFEPYRAECNGPPPDVALRCVAAFLQAVTDTSVPGLYRSVSRD